MKFDMGRKIDIEMFELHIRVMRLACTQKKKEEEKQKQIFISACIGLNEMAHIGSVL